MVPPGLGLRDNQLDELSQGSLSTTGTVVNLNGVDPGSGAILDSPFDAVMFKSNVRKWTLSSGSSSDSGPSETAEKVSYSNIPML